MEIYHETHAQEGHNNAEFSLVRRRMTRCHC